MDWPVVAIDSALPLGADADFSTAGPFDRLWVNQAQPVQADDGLWRFPVPGIYHYRSPQGGGYVLVHGQSRLGCADMVWELVTASTLGGGDSSPAFYEDPEGETLRMLTRPAARAWECGPSSGAAVILLKQMGVPARTVQWIAVRDSLAHQSVEIDLGDEGGWTLYDPHFGEVFRPGVSGLDVWLAARGGTSPASFLRTFRRKAIWLAEPWSALAIYDLAIGLWDAREPLPLVAIEGTKPEQLRPLLSGAEPEILSVSDMRAEMYAPGSTCGASEG